MTPALCIPVIETDGWEEAQAPIHVKEPRRVSSFTCYCVSCGQVFAWVHTYLKEGGQEPRRTSYHARPMRCVECGGDPSFRDLHIFFYVKESIITGPKATMRELELAAKTKQKELAA